MTKKQITDQDRVLEVIDETNPEALYPTDMKKAIIGYVERFGQPPLILLDREKCINILIRGGIKSREDAEEYFEFNTIGAGMGENTPCFATLTKTLRKYRF